MGVFGAFVVALFTEMYGFPLTIYLLTSLLGNSYPVVDPFTHINGHFWVALLGGSVFVWALVMLVSSTTIVGGLIIMSKGWKQIHGTEGGLVTSGLYRYTRHPQYSALFLITIGFLIQWPTIITAVMWPFLMFMYYRLARREERDMESQFGDEYAAYKSQVPMFVPRFGSVIRRAES